MTQENWQSAVNLLHDELGRAHTLMIQLFNWPGSPAHTADIPRMIESNRWIMQLVTQRIAESQKPLKKRRKSNIKNG